MSSCKRLPVVATCGTTIACVFAVCPVFGSGHLDEDARISQLLCGPRCIRFVLREHGRDSPSLSDLVFECQWPDVEAGASMASISSALERRGVHTLAVAKNSRGAIDWPHPAIVHVNSPRSSIGAHYVVCLPASGRTHTIVWWGDDNGPRVIPTWQFHEMIDGGILLTSDSPLDKAVSPFILSTDQLAFRGSLLVAVIGTAFGVLTFWRARTRNHFKCSL